jgi:zinc/manganese transport system substrate-binding protein
MMVRRVLAKVMVSAAFLMALAGPGVAQEKPRVVATFTIIGDLVQAVGGNAVSVTTLVGPDGDAHVFEPRPSDVAAVAKADLIVANGLGMEPWLERLTEAADFKGKIVIASAAVTPRMMPSTISPRPMASTSCRSKAPAPRPSPPPPTLPRSRARRRAAM